MILRTLVITLLSLSTLSITAQMTDCVWYVDGTAHEPVPPTTTACQDGSDMDNLTITAWEDQPDYFQDRLIIVTTDSMTRIVNDEEITGEFVIGVSTDGRFDFSDDGTGQPYATGEYKFTVMAYNQADVDELAQSINPFLPILFPDSEIESIPCCPANLAEIFEVIEDIGGAIRIHDFEVMICETLLILQLGMEYSLSTPYTVAVESCGTVGIAANPVNPSVQIIPNPSTDLITLTLPNPTATTSKVAIYDVKGQLVVNHLIHQAAKDLSIVVEDYDQGIYWITLEQDGEKHYTKFVKN